MTRDNAVTYRIISTPGSADNVVIIPDRLDDCDTDRDCREADDEAAVDLGLCLCEGLGDGRSHPVVNEIRSFVDQFFGSLSGLVPVLLQKSAHLA